MRQHSGRLALMSLLLILLIGSVWFHLWKPSRPTQGSPGPAVVIVTLASRPYWGAGVAYLFDPDKGTLQKLDDAGFAVWSPKGSYVATMWVDELSGRFGGLSVWDYDTGQRAELEEARGEKFEWSVDERYLVTGGSHQWGLTWVDVWVGDGSRRIWEAHDSAFMGGSRVNCYRFCSPVRWEGNHLVMLGAASADYRSPTTLLWQIDLATNRWTLLDSWDRSDEPNDIETTVRAWWADREEHVDLVLPEGVEFVIRHDELVAKELTTGRSYSAYLPMREGRIDYIIWSPQEKAPVVPEKGMDGP